MGWLSGSASNLSKVEDHSNSVSGSSSSSSCKVSHSTEKRNINTQLEKPVAQGHRADHQESTLVTSDNCGTSQHIIESTNSKSTECDEKEDRDANAHLKGDANSPDVIQRMQDFTIPVNDVIMTPPRRLQNVIQRIRNLGDQKYAGGS